ncbi:MAG TPA: carboxypeptidase-like regulatory domain-containing protein, partial [Blastocatellia bacterium]|nr:carboxypeptidase-like regulatory domain-containing protein [Blastocatellia bacterium]
MFNINLIRRFPLFSIIIFTLVLWTVMLAPAGAQTDQSRISGTVHDQVGAVIPGATITIRNERTGETRT